MATAILPRLLTLAVRDDDDGQGSGDYSDEMVMAHGICMGLAFVVLFPLGASWMRFFWFKHLAWFHAGWQITSYLIAIAGLGLGIHIAREDDELLKWTCFNGHPVTGIIVVGALFLQPFLGLFHHLRYRKTRRPTPLGIAHRWYGRVFLILGAINGGLGLWLAGEDHTFIIVFCVCAGVFFSIWALSLLLDARRPQKLGT